MARPGILLIDDDKDLCRLVKFHLEAVSDFEVFTATDGESGIRLAKELKPNLILLDVLMPQMTGHEVLERLKKDKATVAIPVLMLSGVQDDISKIKAAQLYDEGYIIKPVDIAVLKAKIEEVLKRRGAHKHKEEEKNA